MNNFRIRGLQIDLARQYETPQYIRDTIDFAARFGYNSVFLYLEDRIRTKSYPYPPKDESYTPETMKDILAHASKLGIELIPVVSTLGHTERFFKHEEMRHMAEVREGVKGRIGDGWNVFCPTLETTYEFWNRYLAELVEIFPSEYFHVGCDEVWNLGLCSECQKILKGKSVGELFAHHIRRIHQITSKLGKRAMIWDDMLEEYPEALPQIPSDIIQCVWQYDSIADRTRNHFGNRTSDRRLAEYDRLGIEYLICPGARNILNAESLTGYAANFKPIGGIVTRWEGPFLEEEALGSAFGGRLWENPDKDAQEVFDEIVEELLGIKDEILKTALRGVTKSGYCPTEGSIQGLLCGPASAYAHEYHERVALLEEVLKPFYEKATAGMGHEILGDILAEMRLELVQFGVRNAFRKLAQAIVSKHKIPERELRKIREALSSIDDITKYWESKWKERRSGIRNTCYTSDVKAKRFKKLVLEILEGFDADKAPFSAILKVRYSLPDYYGLPYVRWSALYEGQNEWHELYNGNPKPQQRDWSDCPFFCIETPLKETGIPKRLKIEYKGYCGIGLMYTEYLCDGKAYRPHAVENPAGKVKGAENVLKDNTLWCRFGALRSEGAFETASAELKNDSLEIVLSEGKIPLL